QLHLLLPYILLLRFFAPSLISPPSPFSDRQRRRDRRLFLPSRSVVVDGKAWRPAQPLFLYICLSVATRPTAVTTSHAADLLSLSGVGDCEASRTLLNMVAPRTAVHGDVATG
ncbi:hypothetical protein LINGRAHAP2_LOCUS7146, partial [Linum grandiflorum]